MGLSESLENKENEIKNLQNSNADMVSNLEELNTQVQNFSGRMESVTESLTEKEATISQLEQEVKKMQMSNTDLNFKLKELKTQENIWSTEKATLIEKCTKGESELLCLNEKNKTIKKENELSSCDLKQKELNINELEKELLSCQHDLSLKEI